MAIMNSNQGKQVATAPASRKASASTGMAKGGKVKKVRKPKK